MIIKKITIKITSKDARILLPIKIVVKNGRRIARVVAKKKKKGKSREGESENDGRKVTKETDVKNNNNNNNNKRCKKPLRKEVCRLRDEDNEKI